MKASQFTIVECLIRLTRFAHSVTAVSKTI